MSVLNILNGLKPTSITKICEHCKDLMTHAKNTICLGMTRTLEEAARFYTKFKAGSIARA
jgi:hypothetical protein